MITHTDGCVHHPMYDGCDECEPIEGIWMQPQGIHVDDANGELEDAPWCRVHQRAWELQDEDANG